MESPQTISPPSPSPLVRALLLLLLPVIASAIYWQGLHEHPDLLKFTQGKGTSVPTAPDRLGPQMRIGSPRPFSRDNLYEYVDGHAEYFIQSGFQGLTVTEYGADPNAPPALVVEIYDMGKALHAFGVLMDESGANGSPLAVGAMGFQSPRGVNFIQGRYFIKLTAFADALPLAEWSRMVASGIDPGRGADGLTFRFPALGEEKGTRFAKENYQGMAFLHNVVERTFQRDDAQIKAFLVAGNAAENSALLQEFRTFFQHEEIPLIEEKLVEFPLWRVQDPYEGEWLLLSLPGKILGIFHPLDDRVRDQLLSFVNPDGNEKKRLPTQ